MCVSEQLILQFNCIAHRWSDCELQELSMGSHRCIHEPQLPKTFAWPQTFVFNWIHYTQSILPLILLSLYSSTPRVLHLIRNLARIQPEKTQSYGCAQVEAVTINFCLGYIQSFYPHLLNGP